MSIELRDDTFCVMVRNQGEFGTFFLREGKLKDYYWCQLTINSTFGVVGYYWSSMGMPAAKFLDKIDRSYVMGKLFGERAEVFDHDATIKQIKQELFRQIRKGDFNYDRYFTREIYQAITEIPECRTADEFGNQFMESFNTRIDEHELSEWMHPSDIPWRNTINPQAAGLWETLWPEFIQALKERS